jgi:Zn-finger protein
MPKYSFFQHTECEYFPCHKNVPIEEFNCLFCYCPLYALGDQCGGNPTWTDSGIKSCQNCTFPHHKNNYQPVLTKLKVLYDGVKKSKEI